MLMQSKMNHPTCLGKIFAQRDLHYWKWIKETIRSANCAPASRLKPINEYDETNRWKMACLILNILIYKDNISD